MVNDIPGPRYTNTPEQNIKLINDEIRVKIMREVNEKVKHKWKKLKD